MLTEYVFSPEIIFPAVPGQKQSAVKASTKELIPLLAPLKDEDTAMSGTSEPVNIPYLPLLFRIAIRSQTKKRSKADASVVEVLFTALLSVIPSLDLSSDVPDVSATSGDIIATLLQVLIETGTALSSATLSRIVTKSANLTSTDPDQVRWSLIETVLAIDFDTFLHPSVAALTSELFSALSSAKPSEQVSRVLGLVVDGFVKARDVMGFVERWTAQLKSGTEGDVWRSDALARVFAGIVEDSLTSPQVVKTVNNLREEKQWIILDAVLRGLRREETETQLLTTGALEAVVKVARKDEGEWRAWRLLVRIGDIKPELLLPAIKNAVRLAKADEHWKETVFASEVLMQISEDSGDASALESTQAVLELASNSLSKHQSWDGKISSVDGSNFGLAVAMAVVGGHLEVLEKVEGSCRNKFIDSLLHAALATSPSEDNVNARHICQALVGRSEFYEHPAVKGISTRSVFTSLLTHTS